MRPLERDWSSIAIATAGGGALVAGTLLPWMSLFAGLQRYSGIAGLYGRLLMTGGVLAISGGMALVVRPSERLRLSIGLIGLPLAGLATWVLLGVRTTIQTLKRHPLILARPGWGPFIALAGGLLIMTLVVRRPRGACGSTSYRLGTRRGGRE